MCWLVVKNKDEVIPEKYIDQAVKHNKDGFGISYMQDGQLEVFKTLDLVQFKEKLSTLDGKKVVVHLRAASIGGVSVANIHPFNTATGVMFHNGTISSFRGKTNKCPTTGCLDSDTKALADLISACNFTAIKDVVPLLQHIITKTSNKLVFHEYDGSVTIMNESLGSWEGNIWYSNDYHIEPVYDTWPTGAALVNKVFVYGTLKEGLSNHGVLAGAKFVSKAKTFGKYYMIGKDRVYPYVLGKDYEFRDIKIEGHQITGEVYEIDDEILARLDRLEGHPTHYNREVGYVRGVETGKAETVYIYVKTNVTSNLFDEEMLEEWVPGNTTNYYDNTNDNVKEFLAAYKKEVEDTVFYSEVKLKSLTFDELSAVYDKYCEIYYGSTQPDYLVPETKVLMLAAIGELDADIHEEYSQLCAE